MSSFWKKHAIQKVILGILCFFVLYIGTYVFLSWGGRYCFMQSGEVRYKSGLSVSDVVKWQPKFIYWNIHRDIDGGLSIQSNFIGIIYSPLIYLDQKVVHKTQTIIPPATKR